MDAAMRTANMKINRTPSLIAAAIGLAAALASCANPAASSKAPAAGSLSVRLVLPGASGGSRTALPSNYNPELGKFTITLTSRADPPLAPIAQECSGSSAIVNAVTAGPWTLTARAYSAVSYGTGTLIAEGSADIQVTTGMSTVVVAMKVPSGNGLLNYSISWPKLQFELVPSAKITPLGSAGATALVLPLVDQDEGYSSSNSSYQFGAKNYSLPGGAYRLEAALSSGPNKRWGSVAVVYVYPNIEYGTSLADNVSVGDLVIPALPVPPSGIAVVNNAQAQTVVTWTDNSSDEKGFEISKGIEGNYGHFNEFKVLGSVGAGVTSFTDPDGDLGQSYFYKVAAISQTDDRISNEYNNKTGCNAYNPTLSLTQWDSAGVALSMSCYGSNNLLGYELQRAPCEGGVAGTFERLALVTPYTTNSYLDTSATPSKSYAYRFRGFGVGGATAFSSNLVPTYSVGFPLTIQTAFPAVSSLSIGGGAGIKISGDQAFLATGATATLHGTEAVGSATAWQWYLDGDPIAGATASSRAIGPFASPVRHLVTVMAIVDGYPCSQSLKLWVGDPGWQTEDVSDLKYMTTNYPNSTTSGSSASIAVSRSLATKLKLHFITMDIPVDIRDASILLQSCPGTGSWLTGSWSEELSVSSVIVVSDSWWPTSKKGWKIDQIQWLP
jgi:hypothetical protein